MKTEGDGVRLLPYCGDLLQFQLERGLSQKDGDVLLTCRHSKVADDRKDIITSDGGTIKITHKQGELLVSLLKCAVVVIEPYGLCRPVILTTLRSPNTDVCLVVHLHSPETNSFVRLNDSFYLKNVANLDDESCSIVDGPTFLFQSQHVIHLAMWKAESGQFQTNHYNLTLSVPPSTKAVSSVGLGEVLILAATEPPESSGENISDLFQSGHPDLYPWQIFRMNLTELVTAKDFRQIPHTYSTITTAILPLDRFGDDRFVGGIILATALAQLVFIDCDGFSRVCQIPFSDGMLLSSANIGEHGDIILIESKNHGVCYVDMETFSVGKHWPDYKTALCDDFLRVGSDQILLLRDSAIIEAGSFLLTDLTHTWPYLQEGVVSSNTTGDALQSMQSAVEALTLRLRISSNVLQSLQVQSQQKETVLHKGRKTLTAALPTKHLHQRQPDLMCIIGAPEEPTPQSDVLMRVADSAGLGLTAQSLWRRVVRGKLVVGVLVSIASTDEDRHLSNIHISLVCANSSSSCQHSTTSYSTMASSGPSASSETDHLKPGETVWVTTATDCPVFNTAALFTYDVVLMWRESTAEGMRERQQCVRNCSLSFKELDELTVDLSTKKVNAGEITKADFLALSSVQLLTRLHVSCEHTAVGGLPGILCRELGFAPVTMEDREGVLHEKGQLEGVRVYKEPISLTSICLEVYTWDRSQLVLFLRALYSVVPTDAVVTPRAQNEDSEGRTKSLAMKLINNELDKLKESLRVDATRPQDANIRCGYHLENVDRRLETDKAMVRLSKLK